MKRQIGVGGFWAILSKKDGIVMAISLVIMLLLTLIGMGALLSSNIDILTTRNQREGKGAFYAAEGGIVYGTKELNSLLATTLSPTSAQLAAITVPSIPGYNFDTFSVASGGSGSTKTVTTGPYAGLSSFSTPYTVTSQASGTVADTGTVRLTQNLEDQLIPLFQFGVFYDGDLEIWPGANMTFNGRIHSNQDIYMGSSATLTVDSRLTSAEEIYRCRKDAPSTCLNSKIRQPDAKCTGSPPCYVNLTYDHNTSNWATKAYNDWGGLVQDSAHGVQELSLPIGTSNPIDLIRRGDTINPSDSTESQTLKDSRMYWKADLRILDGVAYNKSGGTVTLDAGVITAKTLYDYREGKVITVQELNVGNLNSCACKPANGILYLSQTQDLGNSKGIRLTNGATLPTGGLTVASDNPIYVKGDYNTNTKKGAAIMGDALTFLSTSWKDTTDATPYNASTGISSRTAANMTMNAAVMTGNTNTTVGAYNGGLENLPRFLENWSGTLTYSGSLVDLWQSQQHKKLWPGTGTVYNPPTRTWSYDTAFNTPANLPPGTPKVRTLARAQWARM